MSLPPPIPFELEVGSDPTRVVRGRVTLPDTPPFVPWVLLVHGHRGFMDWAFLPELARRLAEAGIAAVALNLSGSGIGADLEDFTEPEAFAKNTYTRELEDLERVRAELDRGLVSELDPDRGGLFGHSRGGGMGLLHAAARGDYRALVLWAPMHRVALFGEESRRSFERRGFIESLLADGRSLRLDRDVLDDARENAGRLDIAAACSQISAPLLLVYGSRDRLLEAGGLEALESAFGSRAPSVRVIEGGGHTLGARHPLQDVPETLDEGLRETVAWFARNLG